MKAKVVEGECENKVRKIYWIGLDRIFRDVPLSKKDALLSLFLNLKEKIDFIFGKAPEKVFHVFEALNLQKEEVVKLFKGKAILCVECERWEEIEEKSKGVLIVSETGDIGFVNDGKYCGSKKLLKEIFKPPPSK